MKRFLISLPVFFLAALLSVCVSCTEDESGSALPYWEEMSGKVTEEPSEPSDTTEHPQIIPEPEPEPVVDTRKTVDTTRWYRMRGIQPSWEDVKTPDVLDYIEICKKTGINTISVDVDKNSKVGKEFIARCAEEGIDIECEGHMMSILLKRSLFATDPDVFRMDASGQRNPDCNGCPSSEKGLEYVYRNAYTVAVTKPSTNHRYYCWLDDGGDICHCEKCRDLSPSDQALIYENTILKALREVDPEAMLAHLAYFNTVDPPTKVKPAEGIFLEFAPIRRDRYHPLAETWIKDWAGLTNAELLQKLAANLKVFPVETAMVLEYWMDESLFCGWDPKHLVKLPWDKDLFLSDLKTYASYGIRNMQCYCYYVGADYVTRFGNPDFLEEYGNGLFEFKK